MRTPTQIVRHTARALALGAGLSVALLAGCSPGHGQSTSKQMSRAVATVAGIKAGNLYTQAKQSYLAGDLDKATRYIDQSLTINPSVPDSHVLRGRILLEQDELEEAKNSFMRAEALKPSGVEAQYYLGIVFERFNQTDKALERYTRAAELEPNNPQYAVAAAETMMDLHQLDKAEEFLTSRSTAFEHNAGVRQTLGHIAMMKGDSEAACKHFDDARLLAPDDTGILEDLVRAQVATHQFGDAESNIARLLKGTPAGERRDLRLLQARCMMNLDRPVEARQVLLDITRDSAGRNDADAWILLGNTSYMLKDMNRVRMAFTNVIALAPSRTEGYMLRALWQRKQNDLPAALASVEKATQLGGSDTEPRMLKGVILRDLGRAEEARTIFSEIIQSDPANEQAKRALATVPETGTGE
jgi:Flp pilus assembly protein TadD